MKTENRNILLLLALFVALMSIPWLVPHLGAFALLGLVPLLCAERIARLSGFRHFFWLYFAAFFCWNFATTWWVCKATVGGGIFASVANAAQMAAIFALFRLSTKRFHGILPYLFLAVAWIAWERWYLTWAEISWPWIVLGNAFANSTRLIQWYDVTGTLGGSAWIWAVNICIFSIMVSLSDGRWWQWNGKARVAAGSALALLIAAPIVVSAVKYNSFEECDEDGTLDVVLAQSNFDPWNKLHHLTQAQQNAQVVGLFEEAVEERPYGENYPEDMLLMMLPETFTSDVWLNDPTESPTWQTFKNLYSQYANVNFLFGASSHEMFRQASRPSPLARKYGDIGWYKSYNSALLTDNSGRIDYIHKNKLVIGTEKTPYPKLFVPLDDALGGVMGRCEVMGEAGMLEAVSYDAEGAESRRVKLGVPICYESIYGEYVTEYVRKGAQVLCVITNDGWWGDTPGYHQHFSYSRLRAIETRRDVARCANTGISAFINQRGDVLQQTGWWVPDTLRGRVNLTERKTFFVLHGDIVGRVCTFAFILLLLSLLVKLFIKK